jgi:hypothetical protein
MKVRISSDAASLSPEPSNTDDTDLEERPAGAIGIAACAAVATDRFLIWRSRTT